MDDKQLLELLAQRQKNNGTIRSVIAAVVAVLLTAVLAVIGTSYRSLQDHEVRITVTETNVQTIVNLLEKADDKLEKVLEELRRRDVR